MTPEQIDELEPGRELDALIAEHVLGFALPFKGRGEFDTFDANGKPVLNYSTDIAAAWRALDRLRVIDFRHVTLEMAGGCWRCILQPYNQNETFSSFGYSAPLAICRAALKAIAHQPS